MHLDGPLPLRLFPEWGCITAAGQKPAKLGGFDVLSHLFLLASHGARRVEHQRRAAFTAVGF